jgi:type IV pilus assembly protein PilM
MAILRSHTEAFGLDLSDGVMRALQFSNQRRGLAVTAFTEQPLPSSIIVKGEPQDPKSLADAIKSLLVKPLSGRFSSRRVVVGLPDSRTFAKVIEAPNVDGAQTQSSIQDEASQFIPYPIDELYLDWKPYGASNGMDEIRAIVNAVPKTLADAYGAALEDADLKPIAFITEPSAIAYALTSQSDPKDIARLIIDLGQERTTFIVVDHDAVTYSSTNHDMAIRSITDLIATSLKITQTESEEALVLCGLDPSRGRAALPIILKPFVAQLVNEIKRIMRFYKSHSFTNADISETMVIGSGATMRHLVNQLSSILKQKVVIGNPWARAGNVKTSGLAKHQRDMALTTVIGLGLLAQSSKTTEV